MALRQLVEAAFFISLVCPESPLTALCLVLRIYQGGLDLKMVIYE